MLTCEGCGLEKMQPPEAAEFLGVSQATLNKYRKDGWILASDYLGVGFLYTMEALQECQKSIAKRNRGVTYDNHE